MRTRLLTALAVCCVMPALASAQTTEVVEYYGLDALGSIRVVFDQSGAIVSRRDYEPFGQGITPITADPKIFAGLFRDDESKLEYAQARMYQSRTGRFTAVDPVYAGLFDPQAWNRYAYARNSPLLFVGPEGLQFKAGVQACTSTPAGITEGEKQSICTDAEPTTSIPASLYGGVGDWWWDAPGTVYQVDWLNPTETVLAGPSPAAIVETLESVLDLVSPGKDFNACMGSGSVGGCLATAAGVVPVGRGGSALARALAKSGMTRGAGQAAHHIVAINARAAADARAILARFGISLHSTANGVFLPGNRLSPNPTGATVHSTMHTNRYYQTVNELLSAASGRGDVQATLNYIRDLLLRGGW